MKTCFFEKNQQNRQTSHQLNKQTNKQKREKTQINSIKEENWIPRTYMEKSGISQELIHQQIEDY